MWIKRASSSPGGIGRGPGETGRAASGRRNKTSPDPFKGFHGRPDIIRLPGMAQARGPPSPRNVADFLHGRRVEITRETVRIARTVRVRGPVSHQFHHSDLIPRHFVCAFRPRGVGMQRVFDVRGHRAECEGRC